MRSLWCAWPQSKQSKLHGVLAKSLAGRIWEKQHSRPAHGMLLQALHTVVLRGAC